MNNSSNNDTFRKGGKVPKRTKTLWDLLGLTASKDAQKKKDEDITTILSHPYFTELNRWKGTKVNSSQIKDPSKKKMVKEYINIVCRILEKSSSDMKSKNIEEISKIFSAESIDIMTPITLSEIDKLAMKEGIPYIFLERNDEIICNYMRAMTDTITDLQWYHKWNSETERILSVLDILYTTMHIIGEEIPSVVNTMNGELKLALKGSKYDLGID